YEIAGGGGGEPAADVGSGGEQVAERDAAEVVADQRAGRGAGGLHGGNARVDLDADAAGRIAHGARAGGVEQLVDQRGHGVDLRIARADEGDGAALCRELERVAHARLF